MVWVWVLVFFLQRSNYLSYGQIETERKLAKKVCILLLVWFVAWTPYAGMNVWIMFFKAQGLSPMIGIIPTVCCKLSAGTNALLYGLRQVVNIYPGFTFLPCNQSPIYQHNLFCRLPKFKAEVRNMMLTIMPLGIINYFTQNETLRSNAHPEPALSEDENTDSVSSNENINTPQRTSVNPKRNPTK